MTTYVYQNQKLNSQCIVYNVRNWAKRNAMKLIMPKKKSTKPFDKYDSTFSSVAENIEVGISHSSLMMMILLLLGQERRAYPSRIALFPFHADFSLYYY